MVSLSLGIAITTHFYSGTATTSRGLLATACRDSLPHQSSSRTRCVCCDFCRPALQSVSLFLSACCVLSDCVCVCVSVCVCVCVCMCVVSNDATTELHLPPAFISCQYHAGWQGVGTRKLDGTLSAEDKHHSRLSRGHGRRPHLVRFLFCSVLFSVLFCSVMLCRVLFYSVPFFSISALVYTL